MTKKLELSFQCEVPWDSMEEIAAGRRNCGECHREVLDLSAHTRTEADAILRRTPGLCVNYRVGLDGAPIYRRPPTKRSLAVLATGLLAACSAEESVEITAEPAALVEAPVEPCLLGDDDGAFGGPLSDPSSDVDAPVTEVVATQLAGAPSADDEEDAVRPGDRNDTRGGRGHHNTGSRVGPTHPPRLGGVPMMRD